MLHLLCRSSRMQKIGEKIVYNTNEEILDPAHTALVLCAFEKIIFNKEVINLHRFRVKSQSNERR